MNSVPSGERILRFAKGEFLFHQDDLSYDLYIIKKGTVRIYKTEANKEINLDTVGPGMVVGEIASIDGGPRTASGVAVEDTEALHIPKEEFQGIIAKVPDYFKKITLILVQRLREIDNRIHQTVEGDRAGLMAAIISLIAFSENCKPCEGGFEIDLKFLENEIANLINIQLSDINGILERFAKEELLRVDRNRIILEKREALDSVGSKVFERTGEIPAT